jgi:hypothetical protein
MFAYSWPRVAVAATAGAVAVMLLIMPLKQLCMLMLRLLSYTCGRGLSKAQLISSSSPTCSLNEWARVDLGHAVPGFWSQICAMWVQHHTRCREPHSLKAVSV